MSLHCLSSNYSAKKTFFLKKKSFSRIKVIGIIFLIWYYSIILVESKHSNSNWILLDIFLIHIKNIITKYNFFQIKKIILIYIQVKYILKNTLYHIIKNNSTSYNFKNFRPRHPTIYMLLFIHDNNLSLVGLIPEINFFLVYSKLRLWLMLAVLALNPQIRLSWLECNATDVYADAKWILPCSS
jgi:hypothetical protein